MEFDGMKLCKNISNILKCLHFYNATLLGSPTEYIIKQATV